MEKELENNFIKIMDNKIAEKLIECGFFYTKEKINKQDIYAFAINKNLMKEIEKMSHQNFNCIEYVIDNKLHF